MSRKYQIGGDTDFFNQLVDQYAQQYQSQEPDTQELQYEEVPQTNEDNTDYQDLQERFDNLQSQYDELSTRLNNLPGQNFQDDSFLNFLFSDEDKRPIDFAADIRTRGLRGLNPALEEENKNIFGNYNVTNLGAWGDQAHQMRESDHNTGDAQDYGVNDPETAQNVISQLQSDPKTKYIIYNKQIWNPSISESWRPYKGSNPHSDHIHASFNRQYGGEDKRAFNPNLASNDSVFQKWYQTNTIEGRNGIPYSPNLDYDYYSFYRNGDYKAYKGGHFPDTYKRPNHETFSNESIYSGNGAKGYWVGEKFIRYQFGGGEIPNPGYGQLDDTETAEYTLRHADKLKVHKNGNFKGLIPLDTWNDDMMNYIKKFKFVEKNGEKFIKVRGSLNKFITPPESPVISSPQALQEGLNNPYYAQFGQIQMNLPQQYNVIRGLDNGTPVRVQDELGNTDVLYGKNHKKYFFGNVNEKML